MQDLLTAIAASLGFLIQNIHVGGWIFLIILAWKASSRWKTFVASISKAEKTAEDSKVTIDALATNHIPHLQESMNNCVSELKGIRSDLLQYALRKD